VTFPERNPFSTTLWTELEPPPALQPLFARILRPSDISDKHLEALNVRLCPPSSPEDLVPSAPDGTSYWPPLTPSQPIAEASYADATKADPKISRRRREFDERLAELQIDNDTGFRIITKTVKPDTKPPRLAYMRKFWEGLESVAQYWDTSLDDYHESSLPDQQEESEKGAKRQRLDSVQSKGTSPSLSCTDPAQATSQDTDAPAPDEAVVPTQSTDGSVGDSSATNGEENGDESVSAGTGSPHPRISMRYKGRRTASGRDMPDQFRADTVKAFVEGTIWPFQCTVAPPRQMPIVQINKLNLPVRQTAAVYRLPKERQKARAGWLEGPLFTIQCRPDTDFLGGTLTERQMETKARLDTMREIGGLLQLASERQRQGKTEARPGEGKWWTTTPRWGGGPGGEVANHVANGDVDVKDVLQLAEDMAAALPKKTSNFSRRPKRKTPAMLWKEIKPGSKLWDPKTDYEAIGKDPLSAYDQVSSPLPCISRPRPPPPPQHPISPPTSSNHQITCTPPPLIITGEKSAISHQR
jgi:hypothetical protein